MGQPGEKTYLVVLVPSDQATAEGCPPGFVKLTGTPGEGSWDEWGPYRATPGAYPDDAAQYLISVLAWLLDWTSGGPAVPVPPPDVVEDAIVPLEGRWRDRR